MLVLIFVIILCAASALALHLSSWARVRFLLREFSQEKYAQTEQWGSVRVVIISLAVVVFLHIPMVFLPPGAVSRVLGDAGVQVGMLSVMITLTVSVVMQFLAALGVHMVISSSMHTMEKERSSSRQKRDTIDAEYERIQQYVPEGLANVFGKKSLADISAGMCTLVQTNILFINFHDGIISNLHSDVQRFYGAFNEMIETAGRITHEFGAYLTRCSAKGLTVLFNPESTAAIDATLKIRYELTRRTDIEDKMTEYDSLFSAAIHKGTVTVAVLSDSTHVQPVIVSPVMKTAERLQNIGKTLRIPLLVSESVLDSEDKESGKYQLRYTGLVQRPSEEQIIPIYDILNAHSPDRVKKIIENRDLFEEARRDHEAGRIRKAYSKYTDLLSRDPHDTATQRFQSICRKQLKTQEENEEKNAASPPGGDDPVGMGLS